MTCTCRVLETSTVPGDRVDPLYNVLKRKDNKGDRKNDRLVLISLFSPPFFLIFNTCQLYNFYNYCFHYLHYYAINITISVMLFYVFSLKIFFNSRIFNVYLLASERTFSCKCPLSKKIIA